MVPCKSCSYAGIQTSSLYVSQTVFSVQKHDLLGKSVLPREL